ncbi:myosin-3-like, partial [Bactrocera tryoni]|uniref:myosin-3-like n=1 Tax=Bactrocera tryoni TaxID=59916 RepID=UPI001A95F9C8
HEPRFYIFNWLCFKRDEAWKHIEYDFNSQCPSGCRRSAKILKKKYLNLKREVKKRVAEDKRSLYLTGGGPPSKKLLTELDEKLLTVLHEKQVSGMQSVYDNDVIAVNIDESVILEENTLESIVDFENTTEEENYKGINESDNVTLNVESNELWNKYDPSKLKTAKNSKLKFEENPQRSAKNAWAKLEDMKAKWTDEKYEAEIKIIYAKHEQRMKLLEESNNLSTNLMKEKHDLEMKILAVDLERKKKELEG